MNGWAIATLVLLGAVMLPALLVTSYGRLGKRLAGYEIAQLGAVLTILCMAQAADRTSYIDVALVLAVLSPAAALVFTKLFTGDE